MTATIVAAMRDPAMFGPWFQGASWNAWRAVLKAAFALPLTMREAETFGALAGGRKPPTKRVKELWIVAGRRSGKDSIASGLAAWSSGIEQGHVGRLRPGEMASVLCLACDRDQAKIVKGYAQSYFTAIEDLRAMVTRETKDGLELSNSAEIIIATNSYRQARGRTILLALLDECAFWRDETSATPDIETYRAILPALATLPSAMLIGISSPYRKSGLLFDKWKAHFGKDDDRVLVIQAESTQLNPTLDPQIIADALASDPAAAKAEWFGQFRDDISNYVSIELIEAAVDIGVAVRPPRPGIVYSGAADVASGTGKDSYAAAVVHRESDQVILDAAIEIKPPFNPQSATAEVAELFKAYGVHTVKADKYAAGFAIEAFARCGITLEYSERDRSAIYVDALPIFTSGRARLIDNRKLVTQFASLERRPSPSGKDRVDHGVNSHDDLCNAAALAMVEVAGDDDAVTTWKRADFGQLIGQPRAAMPAAPSPRAATPADAVGTSDEAPCIAPVPPASAPYDPRFDFSRDDIRARFDFVLGREARWNVTKKRWVHELLEEQEREQQRQQEKELSS